MREITNKFEYKGVSLIRIFYVDDNTCDILVINNDKFESELSVKLYSKEEDNYEFLNLGKNQDIITYIKSVKTTIPLSVIKGPLYTSAVNWFNVIKVEEYKPIKYLEIGTLCGANLIKVCDSYAKHSFSECYCIDPWMDYDNYPEYKNGQDTNFNNFNYNIDLFNIRDKIRINRGFSGDIIPKFNNNFFDIIYIDGNHEDEYVLEDAVLSFRKAKIGGYIIFDDYGLCRKSIDFFLDTYKKHIKFIANQCNQIFIQKTGDL